MSAQSNPVAEHPPWQRPGCRAAALPRHETAALSAFNELRCGILGVDDEREAGDVVDSGDVA